MNERSIRVAASVVLAAIAAAVYGVAVWTTAGQRRDQRVFEEMANSQTWRELLHRFGFEKITDPRLWLIACVAVIVLGLIARRRWSIVALLALAPAGVIIARILRTILLERPELLEIARAGFNTFPSGHTAAAAGTVAAALRAAPRLLSPIIAIVGTLWVTVVTQGLMEVGAHRPSDVIGSLFIVGALMMLVPSSPSSGGWSAPVVAVTAVVSMIVPVAWAVHTHHGILALIGCIAAVVLAMLTAGPRPTVSWRERGVLRARGNSVTARSDVARDRS